MTGPAFGALVIASLERLAERDIDFTPHVRARLFAARQEHAAA